MKFSSLFKSALIVIFTLCAAKGVAQTPQYEYPYGTSGNAIPLGNTGSTGGSWYNQRSQFLYHAGFYTPAAPPAGLITAIYFKITQNSIATTFTDFKVSIGNTTLTALSASYVTGLTQAINATSMSFPSVSANGWLKIPLTTPVTVDLTKNIIVDVSMSTINGGAAGGYDIQTGSAAPGTGNNHVYTYNANQTPVARAMSYRFGFDIVTCSTAVTTDPVAAITCEEDDATFTMAGQDIGTYQWQVSNNGSPFSDLTDGSQYSGATSGTLTVKDAPFSSNGNLYRCIIAKPGCKDTTKDAPLTVNGLVKLSPMPAKDTTCIGSTEDLVLKGNGSITGHRWQVYVANVGYIDVPQAPPYIHMGNVLRISGVPDTLNGSMFRCIVDGICDMATSTELQLTVRPIPSVGVPPIDTFVKPGMTAVFVVQATAAGARYQWQAAPPTGNFVNLNEGGIYTGTQGTVLAVKGVSTVQNNFRFRCIVMSDLMCNSPGDTSDEAILTVETTSVNDIDGDGVQLVVYPNPANASDLYIAANASMAGRTLEYKIVDKTGRMIMNGAVAKDNTRIDISKLPADVYMIQLTQQGKPVAQTRFTRL